MRADANGTDREAFQWGDWLVALASVNIGSPQLLHGPQSRTVMQLLQVAVANEPLDLVPTLHKKKKKKKTFKVDDNQPPPTAYLVTNKTRSLNYLSCSLYKK